MKRWAEFERERRWKTGRRESAFDMNARASSPSAEGRRSLTSCASLLGFDCLKTNSIKQLQKMATRFQRNRSTCDMHHSRFLPSTLSSTTILIPLERYILLNWSFPRPWLPAYDPAPIRHLPIRTRPDAAVLPTLLPPEIKHTARRRCFRQLRETTLGRHSSKRIAIWSDKPCCRRRHPRYQLNLLSRLALYPLHRCTQIGGLSLLWKLPIYLLLPLYLRAALALPSPHATLASLCGTTAPWQQRVAFDRFKGLGAPLRKAFEHLGRLPPSLKKHLHLPQLNRRVVCRLEHGRPKHFYVLCYGPSGLLYSLYLHHSSRPV